MKINKPIVEQTPDILSMDIFSLIKQIKERIEIANQYLKEPIRNLDNLNDFMDKIRHWDEYNLTLLMTAFSGKINNECRNSYKGAFMSLIMSTDEVNLQDFRRYVNNKIRTLESINSKLHFYPKAKDIKATLNTKVMEGTDTKQSKVITKYNPKDIFIVHGTNAGIKNEIAYFITKLGLKPIILHEQANGGKTVIEKFEREGSKVGFAIALLTDDDEGHPKGKSELTKLRARQNVILELGYFYGKLGRSRVCSLHSKGIELPSDINGVVYLALDEAGAWKQALAMELKEAGYELDLTALIG